MVLAAAGTGGGHGAVAPMPVTIKCSPAALQIVLMDALGAAMAFLPRDEGLAWTGGLSRC